MDHGAPALSSIDRLDHRPGDVDDVERVAETQIQNVRGVNKLPSLPYAGNVLSKAASADQVLFSLILFGCFYAINQK